MDKPTKKSRLPLAQCPAWSRLLLAAVLVIAAAAPAKAQFINGSFIKGCNLAWENGDYNNWLGLDPTEPSYGIDYNSGNLNSYMANMHSMGITVLRVWINEGDMGDNINGSDYVTSVTSTFTSNFANMVQLASNNGIQLYVTLNNGRSDWLENTAQAASYLNNALIPLINTYKGNNTIFAIDLMNEIDGVVQGSLGNYTTTGATWAQAQSYISTFAAAIHKADSSRKVTCSTGWHQWNNLSYFKGLGLDFYDFHNYQDTPSFPTASSLGMDKPIYIGECGQGTNSWNDSIQSTCELDALNSAYSGGYAGVGIWDYGYAGDTEIYCMINSNGSNRAVCTTIKNWTAGGGGGGGGNLISNGTYTLTSVNSGMVLDVPGASTANSVQLDQWASNGNANQKWQLTNMGSNVVELVNQNSGKAVDVYNSSTTAGAVVDQYTLSGNNNQRWTVVSKGSGDYELINVNSNMALDVVGASKTEGALIDQYTTSGNANQLWEF
jgi:hypothetical protein